VAARLVHVILAAVADHEKGFLVQAKVSWTGLDYSLRFEAGLTLREAAYGIRSIEQPLSRTRLSFARTAALNVGTHALGRPDPTEAWTGAEELECCALVEPASR
jgi:hypothetical protein